MENTSNIARIVIPKNPGNAQNSEELLHTLGKISKKDIRRIGDSMERAREIRLQREKEEREKEEREKREEERKNTLELMGNTDRILKYLKENHVVVEENVEMMGYKGKKIHINLPAVGEFEGFKFDCFASDVSVYQYYFKNNFELEKKSYSMEEISKLLGAINSYMKAMGVDISHDVHGARNCLKYISGLDNLRYWLSDKSDKEMIILYLGIRCARLNIANSYPFSRIGFDDGDANLLLKLSD